MEIKKSAQTPYLYNSASPFSKKKADGSCADYPCESSYNSSMASDAIRANRGAVVHFGSGGVCGTDNFVPFHRVSQLGEELSKMKQADGKPMFNSEMLESILNSENDIGEMSKIIHELKKNNIELLPQDWVDMFSREGLSLSDIQKNISVYNILKNAPQAEFIKDYIENPSVVGEFFTVGGHEIEAEPSRVLKNLSLIEVLEKHQPEMLDVTEEMCKKADILDVFCNSKVDKDKVLRLLEANVLPHELNEYDVKDIFGMEELNKLPESNLRFLQDVKNHPQLSFLYSENRLKNYDVLNFLVKELPEGLELKNQHEMIDFLKYMHSNEDISKILPPDDNYLKLLIKNDCIADGKKIIDILLKNNSTCSVTNYGILNKYDFSDLCEILNGLTNNSVLNYSMDKSLRLLSLNASADSLKRAVRILEEAGNYECFQDLDKNKSRAALTDFLAKSRELTEFSDDLGKMYTDITQIKPLIHKFAQLEHEFGPELWNVMREGILFSAIDKSLNPDSITPEKLAYLKELRSCPELDEYSSKDFEFLSDFLKSDYDIAQLRKNRDKVFKFFKASDTSYGLMPKDLLTYDGDIDKLFDCIEDIKLNYPDIISLRVSLNNTSGKPLIAVQTDCGYLEHLFDKNMRLLEDHSIDFLSQNDSWGEDIVVETTRDYVNNTRHIVEESVDFSGMKTQRRIVTTTFDNDENVISHKVYKPSPIPSVWNVKEIGEDSKIKTLCSAYENNEGMFIKKELQSLDGTKSFVDYQKNVNGDEVYKYRIVDKDGNELLDRTRTTVVLDKNNVITTVDGREYRVKHLEDMIEVFDTANNKKVVIDLHKLNPSNSKELAEMLKSLSGDELINLSENVSFLTHIKSIDSSMDPLSKEMCVGPHKFILEHELGHAKDEVLEGIERLLSTKDALFKIASDSELQEIFNAEKSNLRTGMSAYIQDMLKYFVDDIDHYGGALGGLRETIAEVNAIQSTGKAHPLLSIRTHLLQENFPKTIAYLIKRML